MSPEVGILTFLAIGLVSIFLFLRISHKMANFNKTGLDAEGVIFEIEWEHNTVGKHSASASYPVIRFVTNDGLWITKRYHQSGILIRQGQKVRVKYNPENPEDFVITSGQFRWSAYIFLVSGIVALIIAIFKVFQYVSD